MNKDKIIKDLKEKNRKLKNQYELQEVRLHSLQHKVDELEEENKRLNNIINKAIKYINEESKSLDAGLSIKKCINVYELLSILRGENNE